MMEELTNQEWDQVHQKGWTLPLLTKYLNDPSVTQEMVDELNELGL